MIDFALSIAQIAKKGKQFMRWNYWAQFLPMIIDRIGDTWYYDTDFAVELEGQKGALPAV